MKNLLLHRTLIALTLFFGILSVLVTIKRFHWSGDLAALIVDYLAIISLLLLVYFGLTRHWRWMSVAGIMLLMNGFALVNYGAIASDAFRSALAQSDGQDDNTVPPTVALRLMVYNMYFQNNDLGAVVDEVRSYDPDILFLMEYSDAIQAKIETEFTNYPYQLIRPSRMTMGLALFSRIPFDETEIHRFEETRIPIFEAVMQVDGKLRELGHREC